MVGRMNDDPGIVAPNIYQFWVEDAEGNTVHMKKYRGCVLLIVNVASQSGFTDLNYKELQQLQKVYADRQFKVLAFPSNQVGNQEPNSVESIVQWARERGCTFDIFGKIDVNGPNTPLLWRYLKTSQRSMAGDFIKWSFTKFIVNRKGQPVERHGPAVPPSRLARSIENYLDCKP